MRYPIAARIEQAIMELIATRDMCGDERQTLKDFEREFGTFTETQRDDIRSSADGAWRRSQRAAGVCKPITSNERMAIELALETEPAEELELV